MFMRVKVFFRCCCRKLNATEERTTTPLRISEIWSKPCADLTGRRAQRTTLNVNVNVNRFTVPNLYEYIKGARDIRIATCGGAKRGSVWPRPRMLTEPSCQLISSSRNLKGTYLQECLHSCGYSDNR